MKPLLVGEANPYGADPYFALYPLPEHASGGRLARILGLSQKRYLDLFDRRNLCPTEWSMKVAREQAELIRAEGRECVVLLGAKVQKAFGHEYSPWSRVGNLYLLPHPSGLCRARNEPRAVDRTRELLADVLTDVFDRVPTPRGRVEERRAAKFVRESIEGGFASLEDFEP